MASLAAHDQGVELAAALRTAAIFELMHEFRARSSFHGLGFRELM
jgi:hypothetical protein